MNKNLVEELKWRGMIHDIMPGTEEQLKNRASHWQPDGNIEENFFYHK